jgi:hypothetical protein
MWTKFFDANERCSPACRLARAYFVPNTCGFATLIGLPAA